MTFNPANTKGIFLDPSFLPPEDKERFLDYIREYMFQISDVTNLREISFYPAQEIITGNQLNVRNANFSTTNTNPFDAQRYRGVFRFVFNLLAPATTLAAGATRSFAHGITGITEMFRYWGTAVTTADFRTIPYASTTANANIEMRVTATNIIVVNGTAAPVINNGLVFLEYCKN